MSIDWGKLWERAEAAIVESTPGVVMGWVEQQTGIKLTPSTTTPVATTTTGTTGATGVQAVEKKQTPIWVWIASAVAVLVLVIILTSRK